MYLKKKEKNLDTHTRESLREERAYTERRQPCVDRDKDLSDTALNQGLPRIARKHKKSEEERVVFLLQDSVGVWPC